MTQATTAAGQATAGATPGPWHALDQRNSTLRAQGWEGPEQDAILIVNYPPAEIKAGHCDCIVARIEFRNRAEKLGDGNMADGRLIAAAPELLEAAQKALKYIANTEGELGITLGSGDALRAAIARATGK